MTAIITVAMAIVRGVIRLYPARFRARFESELIESVRADLGEASRAGLVALLAGAAHAIGEAASGLVAEHRGRFHAPRFALGDDIRDGWRSLRQSPTFTAVALIVLALGIGAGTAIFSIVDAVVLRGLPFDQHDRIVAVLENNPQRPGAPTMTMPQIFLDWRDHQQSFAFLAATNRQVMRARNVTGELENTRVLRVTRDFFPLLRVQPALGRLLTADDEVRGQHRVAILSHDYWLRHFGGAPDAVGRRIELDEEPWEVVGVMPPGFSFPVGSQQATEIFTPLPFTAADRVRRGGRSYQYFAIGRLKDGVSLAQARDDMDRVAAAVDTQYPGWNTLNPGGHVRLLTLHEFMVGGVRSWMLLLLGSVALLLIIACANVANLMLARATVRGREMGLRAALGASGWRITRALIIEGILLSLAAAAIGIAIAFGAVTVLKAWMPAGIPRVAVDRDRSAGARRDGRCRRAHRCAVRRGARDPCRASGPDRDAARRRTHGDGGARRTPPAQPSRRRRSRARRRARRRGGSLHGQLCQGAAHRSGLRLSRRARDQRRRRRSIRAASRMPSSAGRPYVERMLEAVRGVPGVQSLGAVSGGLPLSGGRVTHARRAAGPSAARRGTPRRWIRAS